MPIDRISIAEFHERLKAQGVVREDIAFKCPVCGTVQSMQTLFDVGAAQTIEGTEVFVGFSCIGRFTNAGPHRKDTPPGRGCDWTLGGLFKLHTVEIDRDGYMQPCFDIATPDEAQALAKQVHGAAQATEAKP